MAVTRGRLEMTKIDGAPQRARQRLSGLLPWLLIAGGVAAMIGIWMN